MKKLTRKWFRQAIALMLIVCMVCSNGMLALADEAVASTMRLARTEGTVTVTNKNGRDMGTMADMKLFSGYQMATAQSSYAWITLDDSKLIKLDAVSEAEIQKKGKDLEVLLNSGNLFFNVTESLKSDETLNIRTSTMVTGIRGTSGWVKVIDSWRTRVYILEGQVECWVMDPVSGQYKGVTLRGGQYAEFVVYDQTREGDKCDIITNNYTENDIDGFVAVELMNDPELREKIKGATGFNVDRIAGNAPNKLNQDQQDVNQKVQAINEQVKQQDNNVSKNPLFSDRSARENSGGSGSGGSGSSGGGSSSSGGSSGTTTPDDTTDTTNPDDELTEITLTLGSSDSSLAATAQNVAYYLSLENMQTVTVLAGEDDNDEFEVDESLTVASGQTLIFGTETAGVDVTINADQSLNVVGTVDIVNGTLTNNGSISNVSNNTLKVMGEISNTSTGTINNTGTIRVTADAAGTTVGNVTNAGSIFNAGTLAANISVETDGKFEHQAGGTLSNDTLTGSLTVATGGYAALYEEEPSSLVIDGGELEVCGEAALTSVALADGILRVSTGGSVKTVAATGGQVIVDGGSVETLDWSKPLTGTGSVVVPTAVTINSGTVGTVSTDGGILYINGGTVTTATAETTAEINGGNVATLVADSALISVYGGNVESVSSTSGGQVKVIGGSITDAVLNDTKFIMTAGSVDTVNMTYAADNDIIISGGTLGDVTITSTVTSTSPDGAGTMYPIFSIEDSGETQVVIDSVELNGLVSYRMAGGTVGELTTECTVDINYGVVGTLNIMGSTGVIGGDSATDENTKVNEVVVTSGTFTVNAGTHGHIELNSTVGIINDGIINDGVTVLGDGASLEMIGGTVNASSSRAAIEVNIPETLDDSGYPTRTVNVSGGKVDGNSNVAVLVNQGYVYLDTGNSGVVVTADNPEDYLVIADSTDAMVDVVIGDGSGPISGTQYLVSGSYEIDDGTLTEPGLKVLTESLSYALQLAKNGDTISVLENNMIEEVPEDGSGVTIDKDITLNLNGNALEIDVDIKIEDSGSLNICDNSGNGELHLYGSIRNYGEWILTEINATLWGDSYNYGIMKVDGGEYVFHGPVNVGEDSGAEGSVLVTGGATLISAYRRLEGVLQDELSPAFATRAAGTITLGQTEDKNPVTLEAADEPYYSACGVIEMVMGTLNLVNVEADLNECAAVYVSYGSDAVGTAYIVVEDGVNLKSDNPLGTIMCMDSANLTLNGGSIYNDSTEGTVILVSEDYSIIYSDVQEPVKESWLSNVVTGLYSKNYIMAKEIDENELVEFDDPDDGYCRSSDTENGYYYLKSDSSNTKNLLSLISITASNAQIKAPSAGEAEDSTANSNSTGVTATDSDAVDTTATDFNADGETPLTTSPAAIPMAAAAFALMAAVYQVVEDEKKRKER